MSISGVRTRVIDALAANNGTMTEAEFKKILDYAKQWGLSTGETAALLDPKSYLDKSKKLKDKGIAVDAIRFDPAAYALAQDLAKTAGTQLFPGLPNINVGASVPPNPGDLSAALAARTAALGKGANLGRFADWSVQTSGADIRFAVDVQGKKFPALVLDKPQWKDPSPKDVLQANQAAFRAINTAAGVEKFIADTVAADADYFSAKGVATKTRNEAYGIQNIRRQAFLSAVAKQVSSTAMPADERSKAGVALVKAEEALISGRDYQMDVGSHDNYWPYWNNYMGFLLRVLEQTAPGTDAYLTIKNRIGDILRRKTVFGWNRAVNERDFEASTGAALVYNPQYSMGVGHRVSLKTGSTSRDPNYEVLSIKSSGLSEALKQYAGAHVVRDTDGSYKFDYEGPDAKPDRTGQAVPAELKGFIAGQDVKPEDIGLRELQANESARANISADWNSNGEINVAQIMIDWWGHCHNEAPLNAQGVDPQKAVELYRAERAIAKDKAKQAFSAEDAWDVAGAFAADHEQEYVTSGSYGDRRQVSVDKTSFVGNRNDGGHYLEFAFGDGARTVMIDAEVTAMWSKSDPTKKYADPMARFRRDIENADGTFSPNPDWVNANVRDEDMILVDAAGRKLDVKTKFLTFDPQGQPYETTLNVALDPTKDQFVKLADEIVDYDPVAGGRVNEHWYNAKTGEYKKTVVDVSKANNFKRTVVDAGQPKVTKTVRSAQETTFDSVLAIHDFVKADIGLPFTFDTSAGMAVWNYPVNSVRLDAEKSADKVENGQAFTYTTYRMRYTTMGGPSGDMRYIIKRDASGKAVRATALSPMADFAFRNDHWVCAPVAVDASGNPAYNLQGLEAGYLTDKARRNIVPDLWARQAAILFASLSDKTAVGTAYVYEAPDGALISFGTKAEFDAAVAADLKVRELEGGQAVA